MDLQSAVRKCGIHKKIKEVENGRDGMSITSNPLALVDPLKETTFRFIGVDK
jgi:hypothetical protein